MMRSSILTYVFHASPFVEVKDLLGPSAFSNSFFSFSCLYKLDG